MKWPGKVQGDQDRTLSACMLDLNSAVPYYDAYLCSALQRCHVDVRLAAISYYLDRECFALGNLQNHAPFDIIGRLNLPPVLRRPLKLVEILANLAALAYQFRRNRPDILHVQYLPLVRLHLNSELAFLGRCRKLGIPVVYTVHDVLPHDTEDEYREAFKHLYHIPDLLICHSEAVREELIASFGLDRQQIEVIPHGPLFYGQQGPADNAFRNELGIPPDVPVALWQGIIHRYKGIDLLLRSWAAVRISVPQAQLLIAGTGSPELLAEIQHQISSLGLNDGVKTCFRYLSAPELIHAYTVADVVVYPYNKVSTSGALMTGLALGKAIVATDLPFFRLALEDGELGRLVDYDERALAGQLIRLLTNDEEREVLERRVAARDFGESAWDKIAMQTRVSYERLLNGVINSSL